MTTLPTAAAFQAEPMTAQALSDLLVDQRNFLANLLGTAGTTAVALATLGALGSQYVAQNAALTLTAADRGKVISGTGTWTLTLPAAASAGAGWSVMVRNSGSGTITVARAGSDLIDGATSLALPPGRFAILVSTGTGWVAPAGNPYTHPNHSGDVTSTGDGATVIANDAVTNAKLANMPTARIKGRISAGTGDPEDLTQAEARSVLGLADLSAGLGVGTGLATVANANAAVTAGEFRTTTSTTNLPLSDGTQAGHLQVVAGFASNALIQRWTWNGGLRRWERRSNDGGTTWGTWTLDFTQATLVGEVAQSGGVPTGAAFERNANGNGRWWKTADGMMRVARDDYLVAPVSTALGGIWRSATVTWTFPQAFASPPIVTGQVADPDCWISVVATTTTQVTFRVLSATSRSSVRVNLSAIGRWFSVGAATPAALFANSQRGFWFEFSDFSKLWQDSARTIPVTAIGNPVGSVEDISGNVHYAAQATSGRRPTLQVDDQGRAYLQFDGVDDGLSVTTLNLNNDSAFTLFAAVRKDTDANVARIVEYSPGVATNPGFLLQQPTAGTNLIQGMHRGATTSQTSTRSGIDAPATFVATVISDLAAPNVQLRVNGTPSTANTGATGGGTYGNWTMFIGSRNNTTTYFTGRIYALVGRAGTTSAEDIAGIETYLNERCGAW
jgi:hypothetical protein